MSSTVEIIIKTIDESTANTKKVSGGLNDLAKTLTKVAGIATGVAVTINKAMDFGQKGAQVDVLRQSFNAMGGDLAKLQKASKGTISDFALMNATNTLLIGTSGKLRDSFIQSSDELLMIAKAANALNPALGDTQFLYESIARGIKRQSPLILDNLGLTIKVGEATEAYAASLGKSVDDLSATEKQQALLNDVLRAGNQLMKDAAGINTEALDSFARMNVAFENMGNAIKEGLAPYLAKAAEGIGLIINFQKDVNALFGDAQKRIAKTSESYEEYQDRILKAVKAKDQLNDVQYENVRAFAMEEENASKAYQLYGIMTEQQWQYYRIRMLQIDAMGAESEAVNQIIQDMAAQEQAARDAADAYSAMYDAANKDWADVFSGMGEAAKFQGAGGQALIDFEAMGQSVEIGVSGLSDEMNKQLAPVLADIGDQGAIAAIMFQQSLGNLNFREAKEELMGIGLESGEAYDIAIQGGRGWEDRLDYEVLRLGQIAETIERINGMSATASVFVNVYGMGGIPAALSGISGVSGLDSHTSNTGVTTTAQATGGPLAPFALVGEQGPELIINGVVVPAPITNALMALGLKPNSSFATGGYLADTPLIDGVGGFPTSISSTTSTYSKAGTESAEALDIRDKRSKTTSSTSGDLSVAAEIPQPQTAASGAMSAAVEQMTNALAASSAEQNMRLDKIYDQLRLQPTQDSQDSGFKSVVQEALAQ